jgi:hypothetical protein
MQRVAGWAVVILLASCGSNTASTSTNGSAGSSGDGGPYVCQSICERASAQCAILEIATCLSECERITTTRGCEAEVRRYLSCASTEPIYCDSFTVSPCNTLALAWASCRACTPRSSDDTCQSCATCCAKEEALLSDPDYLAYGSCVDACIDASCVGACNDERVKLKVSDVFGCAHDVCPACLP